MTTKSDPQRSRTPRQGTDEPGAAGGRVSAAGTAAVKNRPTPGNAAMLRNILGVVVIGVLVAAIACAGWFGYRAYEAYAVAPTQQARDDATGAAEQAMLNVTTIDPKNMNAFSQRLQSSFAGDALDQVRQQVAGTLDPQLQQAGSQVGSTTSRVVRSAPTQVNADEGTAQVLVYVAVTGKTPGQASETANTMGFLVGMRKFGDTWKAVKVSPLDGISYADDGSSGTGTGSGGSTPAPTGAPTGGN
ncbi:hypothetical protein EF294_19395 [Gordonia oryzae]|uniref:Mammalian cell entry protein n=1 Tax=Gordonia oryzae TaxID=2487349 RepID=A0A3N4GDU3_9ACTN|nr:hypothetical protein [Gordonia oryzae]RPA57201.1 hypothetical protein EF294_19395 [Gordonia oryzae]